LRGFIIVLILITNVFGSNENYELKLYEKILPSIFKKHFLIYTDSKNKDIIEYSSNLKMAVNCRDADLLLGKGFKNLSATCQDKPVFSTSYRSFLNNPNAIGAFYWRKGRPQIRFKADALKKYDLKLPKSLEEFVR